MPATYVNLRIMNQQAGARLAGQMKKTRLAQQSTLAKIEERERERKRERERE